MFLLPSQQPKQFHGWYILAMCTLCQFTAIGFTMYLLGIYIEPLSEAWSATPGQIGSAAGLFAATGALTGPLLGFLADKGKTKGILLLGAIFMASGLLLMSQVSGLVQAGLVCMLLIAPGAAMLGSIPTTVMVAQWFEKRRGFAIGVTAAGISMGGFIMPMVAAWLLKHYDWQVSLLVLGSLVAVILIPAVWLVAVAKPSDIQQYRDGIEPADDSAHTTTTHKNSLTVAEILSNSNFWVISVCVGIMSFLGVLMITYIAPYARESGATLQEAAFIISLYSIFGITGKFTLGWLCDKLPPHRMMTLTLALISLGWLPLLFEVGDNSFMFAAAVVGFAMGGMLPVWSSMIALLFGLDNFGRVRGIMSLALVIFTILPGPLGGYLRDNSGSYVTTFSTLCMLLPLGLIASLLLWRSVPSESSEK